jgi:hypothetical protein
MATNDPDPQQTVDPQDLAGLGELRAEFGPNYGRIVAFFVSGVLSSLLGLALFLCLFGVIPSPIRRNELTELASGTLIAAVFVCMGFAVCYPAARKLRVRIAVFAGGLAFVNGAKQEVYLWRRVTAVYQWLGNWHLHVFNLPRSIYTVRREDGAEFCFTLSVKNARGLARIIQDCNNPRLLKQAIDDYFHGKTCSFDYISVAPGGLGYKCFAGIGFKEKCVPWQEFQSVEFAGDRLLIHKVTDRGPHRWAGSADWVPAGKVANIGVLHDLLGRIRSSGTPLPNVEE